MQWPTNLRLTALNMISAACLVACAQSSAPRTTASESESDVERAYAALVSDVASCAKQVKSCVDDADSDEAARAACRADFASCRDAAGKSSVNALASGARGCTSSHNSCVRSADHGEAASCQDALRMCLGAAHAAKHDDEDAGDDDRKGARADCLDELHPCVMADGPANACAEQVRMCVVDSVPSASAVVPDADSDDDSDEAGPSDAGGGKGKSKTKAGHPSNTDAAADAGTGGKGMLNPARMCVDSLHACVDAGNPARDCAKSLKECRASAAP